MYVYIYILYYIILYYILLYYIILYFMYIYIYIVLKPRDTLLSCFHIIVVQYYILLKKISRL